MEGGIRTIGRMRGLVFAACALLGLAAVGDHERSGPVEIGMVDTFFRDISEKTLKSSGEPFAALIKAQTGRGGEIIKVEGVDALGKMLAEGKVELGVFHGFEYGWARQKYPKLTPLVIAVNQNPHLTAHVLVAKDSSITGLGELKGKTLALPAHSKEHCYLFLERHPKLGGQDPKQFLGKITDPPNIEDALDDVVDGLVQGAMTDGIGLERYKIRKPARFAKLKEIERSAVFPTSVVAYGEGAIDETTLAKLRKALLTAADSSDGQQLLTMWKLTGFERVPDDYRALVEDITRRYPPKPRLKP